MKPVAPFITYVNPECIVNKITCFICLMYFASASLAQSDRYAEDLLEGIAMEDTASTLKAVEQAAMVLTRVTKSYPGRWEALYWTSHAYSQAGLFAGTADDRYLSYQDSAQVYYDRAWAAKSYKTKDEEADFFVLQANLHALRGGFYAARQQWQQAQTYEILDQEFMLRTAMISPNNPRLQMRRGINLMRGIQTRNEGRVVLRQAQKAYEDHHPASALHPNWGRNRIDIWLNRYSERTD